MQRPRTLLFRLGEIFTQALTVTSLQLVRLNQASLNVLGFLCHVKHFAGICFELILSFFFLFSLPGHESREDPPTQLGEMLPRPEEEAQTSHQVLLIISVLSVRYHLCSGVPLFRDLTVHCTRDAVQEPGPW